MGQVARCIAACKQCLEMITSVLCREENAPVGQVARCIAACLATFSCNARSAEAMMSPGSPVVSTLLVMLTARETSLFQGELQPCKIPQYFSVSSCSPASTL